MKTFSSLAAVMGLWLAVSFLLWLCYRIFRRRDGSKQKRLVNGAIGLIDEGAAVFSALRTRDSLRPTAEGSYRHDLGQPDETLRDDVRSLLNKIEAQSPYFDRVNAAKKKIQNTFGVPDFLALTEILQIRRDFWAASEIFLMDDIRALGPELADAGSYETFQAEAQTLLFQDESALARTPGQQDPVELRLAIAHEEAVTFKALVERDIAAQLEKSRFPSPVEIAAVPWGLVKGVAAGLREVRHLLGDAAVTAQGLARALTEKGLMGTAEELRRVRSDMPGQFATAFERAGGLARQGGQGLKRHYEFVLEAQELRARYAELLARAPNLSEKGAQFLARLEIERRAEQFRETSGNLFDWARQELVVGIAYLIAALQYVQAKVTPLEHKQLAPRPIEAAVSSAVREQTASEPEMPLRVLLLPAAAYAGGVHGRATGPAARKSQKAGRQDPRSRAEPDEGPQKEWTGRLRDLVTGAAHLEKDVATAEPPPRKNTRKEEKPRFSYTEGLKKMSFKDVRVETSKDPAGDPFDAAQAREPKKTAKGKAPVIGAGSLLERLSSLDRVDSTNPGDGDKKQQAEDKPKGRWFSPFNRKRT
jgi:hypothetical protein